MKNPMNVEDSIDYQPKRPLSVKMRERLKEGMFLFSVACGIFMLLSLITYHPEDPSWSSTGNPNPIFNWGGWVGAWYSDIFLSLFGMVSYLFPILIMLISWFNLDRKEQITYTTKEKIIKSLGFFLVISSCCGLAYFYIAFPALLPAKSGGILGHVLGHGLSLLFNKVGSSLIFFLGMLVGITLVTGLSWLGLLAMIFSKITHIAHYQPKGAESTESLILLERLPETPVMTYEAQKTPQVEKTSAIEKVPLPVALKPVKPPKMDSERSSRKKIEVDPAIRLHPGTLPSADLLNPSPPVMEQAFAQVSFEELSALVERRLFDFGVEVKVVAVHPGPIITRFELELAPGIKVSKISGLAKDIARSLSTVSVRIVDVIPGKSVIGLEIPNENRELVTLREVLESQRYSQSRSPISLILGKDISGNPVVVDLMKMPHLLVAGTTGSGKSVSLNTMLLSMLFKAIPEQLRLILIDPKMLELSVYDGIPHLLTPVITDMKDASNALRWCVGEMDRRYKLMAALGVRNIINYNQKVSDAIKQGQPIGMPSALVVDEESAKAELHPLPYIVVIIDELADMMMVVGKKVEDLIARIAQKARAAGIHLIIATQRPSVDVITGLIKANIPTRIAFQVSSRIDSRTILDQQGAEQLLGHGDMLYLPPGAGVPIRVHGAYVTDEEVHRVVAAWRSSGEPVYYHDVVEENADHIEGNQSTGEQDPLYDEAVRIVTETRRASISLVQRRLRIGYNRAARMMEEMELAGVVSTVDNSGSREVLAAEPILD